MPLVFQLTKLNSRAQLPSVAYSAFIAHLTTMAAPEQSKTHEQSSDANQHVDHTNGSSLAKNDRHHVLDPRATSFTPHIPAKLSPTHQPHSHARITSQLTISPKIEDLIPDKKENCVLRARVQDDIKLAFPIPNLSKMEYPMRQPTVPPTPEDLMTGRKKNFVWHLGT